jgi:hypothetical protein
MTCNCKDDPLWNAIEKLVKPHSPLPTSVIFVNLSDEESAGLLYVAEKILPVFDVELQPCEPLPALPEVEKYHGNL